MTDVTILLFLLTVLATVLFLIGVPIILVFGVWAIGYHLVVPVFPMSNIAITSFEELQSFPYVAIPLFIVVGDLIYETGISGELIDFAHSIVGWLPGSSGNAALVTSGIFSAITGSNAATTASVGKAMYPELLEKGYEDKFAAATIASGGVVGSIIPPSILLIVYGVTFNVSITDLFLAGIVPGLCMLTALILTNMFIADRNDFDTAEGFSFDGFDVVASAWRAKLGLGAIVVLLGGIFSGIFTPSEAASVAIFYIVVTSLLSRKLTSLDQVSTAIFTSLRLTGALVPVVTFAVIVQQNLSYLGLQDVVSEFVIGLGHPFLIMSAMIVILLFTGSTLSSVPNLVLAAPLLAGAAGEIGLTPVMWGIIFMMSDSIGFITPPYGINLFVISGITDIDYISVARRTAPFLAVLIIVWLAFFTVPDLNFLI